MWIRASARQAPPTKYKSLPTAWPSHGTVCKSASAIARARTGSPPERSASRITPSFSVCDGPRVPSTSRTTSSEPPPISASTPSAAGIPHSIPSAA